MSVQNFIENTVDLSVSDFYAAILGETPSQGAKSPALWNAAFEGLSISALMHPFDVRSENLSHVVEALRADSRFVGGAVTMPYKIDILPLLDEVEPEAAAIGAVNCVYRNGDKLVGSNTDGAGALWSLQAACPTPLAGKKVLILGAGGAACAVAAYVAGAVGADGLLVVCNRSEEKRDALVKRLLPFCPVEGASWPVSPETAAAVDIVINCTSLGFEATKADERGAYTLRFYTPLGEVDDRIRVSPGEGVNKRYLVDAIDAISLNQKQTFSVLAAMDNPFVFDIVYQPVRTLFLAMAEVLGYQALSGVGMNLEQAVIAFDKASSSVGLRPSGQEEVRNLMSPLW